MLSELHWHACRACLWTANSNSGWLAITLAPTAPGLDPYRVVWGDPGSENLTHSSELSPFNRLELRFAAAMVLGLVQLVGNRSV
ncbi:MAG: hypothetical protein M3Y27_12315 [Acidobacteriota bacterium]|nr:hypothetical protein [Acidobacteriota bacterium]